MTYVVAEPCVNCRYTDCALVCPVEAFHLDDDMLVINPETCIDCDACVPECPGEAIFPEDKEQDEWAGRAGARRRPRGGRWAGGRRSARNLIRCVELNA